MDDARDDSVTATSAIAGVGSLVAGRYQVRGRLGRGGAKEVYLAYDVRLDREVALAIIVGGSEGARARFEREARVTGRLGDHPNVITVYDTGEYDGVAFLVLRAMAGGSLADAIDRRRVSVADAMRFGREIAAALAHAHALGVVHRDVKPDNVWLAADGTAALGDFGIARQLGSERVTAEGIVVGSVRYISPEQIRGFPGGTASDLYSLGVTLYELVSGQVPFDAPDPQLVLTQHLTAAAVPPSERNPAVPAALDRLILELLAKDPAQRPASASVVEDELARIQAGDSRRPGAQVVCPFKGLASFDVADAAYFCGRERLTAQLVTRLVGAALLGILGPSGSGKSSVMRAGLMPALAEGVLPGSEDWAQVLIRPGRHPLRELTAALDQVGGDRVVLAVDQFEETFTACDDEDERRAFIAALVAATRDREARCTVLLALRADFYGHCAAYPELATMLAANHVLVGAMRGEELRQAIEDPAERAGLHVDGRLTDALVREVEGAPGALPLLSTALLELWQQRDGDRIEYAAYERTGGVRGAVSRLAEAAFGRLDGDRQRTARNVLMRLVGEGADGVERRRVELAELETLGEDAGAIVGRLTADRLLTAASGTVELAHEALLREWPRLREWIEEDRDGLRVQRHIRAAAREWLRLGRDDGALYRGGRLAEALAWQEANATALNALEREFLTAGEARRRHDAVTRRRRLTLAFSSATIALIAIGVAVTGFISERRESALQRDVAASNDLAERAADLLDSNPGLSRKLALAAHDRYDTDQAESAVRQATLEDRATAILPGRATFWGLTANRTGRLVAAAADSGVVRIFDVRRRALVSTIRGHRGDALHAAVSPDDARVATGGEDGVVAIADVDGRNRRTLLTIPRPVTPRGNGGANSVEFGRDGRSLLVGGRDGTVRLIDIASGRSRHLGRRRPEVQRAHFDSTGTKVVSAGAGGTWIWDVAKRTAVALDRAGAHTSDAVFSPDGARVASVDVRGYLRIWSTRARRIVVTERIVRDGLNSVSYSRDGRQLVTTAAGDGIVRVLDARSGVVLHELKGHQGGLIGAVFASGGTIVSGGGDGDLRIWAPPETMALRGDATAVPDLSADRRHVLWSDRDRGLHRWEVASGRDRVLRGLRMPATTFRIAARESADGSTIAYWPASFGPLHRYAVGSGRSRLVATDATQKFAVALDRTGRRIALSSEGRVTIRGGGGPSVTVPVRTRPVTGLAFSPDGRHLYTGSDDGAAAIVDATTGTRELTLPGRAEGNDAAWSADGRRIVTSGSDGAIRIRPVDGGDPAILYGHDGPVVSAAFNRRGDRIVSAGADGTVRVWDATEARQLVVVKRYGQAATGAAFSADGDSVVSAGADASGPGRAYVQASSCDACGPLANVLETARSRADPPISAADRKALGLPKPSSRTG